MSRRTCRGEGGGGSAQPLVLLLELEQDSTELREAIKRIKLLEPVAPGCGFALFDRQPALEARRREIEALELS
jgi:hypothetical protein